MNDYKGIERLALPPTDRALPVVLDTDTYNEVDDQFALAYALLSGTRLKVEAIYAAPFYNDRSTGAGDGMEKSFQEIKRLLGMGFTGWTGPVLRGATQFLTDERTASISEAAKDLAQRAMEYTPQQPLYVVAIGAITNVASALLLRPEIAERIVVVWLGGQPHSWENAREFNLSQDIAAVRVVMDSGAAFVQIPCQAVASHLITTVPELTYYLRGKNELCDYLTDIVAGYTNEPYGWSKVIWDISAVAYLIEPEWVPTQVVHMPLLSYDHTWSLSKERPFMRVAKEVRRDRIFADLFAKLSGANGK